MKKTLTLSLSAVAILLAFASCKKDYNCKCYVEYQVNGHTTGFNNTVNTIRSTSEDGAKSQCVNYETSKPYLGQVTVEKHTCAIE